MYKNAERQKAEAEEIINDQKAKTFYRKLSEQVSSCKTFGDFSEADYKILFLAFSSLEKKDFHLGNILFETQEPGVFEASYEYLSWCSYEINFTFFLAEKVEDFIESIRISYAYAVDEYSTSSVEVKTTPEWIVGQLSKAFKEIVSKN